MTRHILALSVLLSICSSAVQAQVIEFPEEELSSETVLPVFDQRRIVLSRNVQKTESFEIGGGFGMSMNEPFYNPLNFHFLGTYHFNELHGVGVQFNSFLSGISSYGKQLQAGEAGGVVFDPSKAPALKYMIMGNYQFDAYYGKISLTKSAVMNLSLFATLGAGMLNFGELTKPGLNVGMGQNFYFTNRFALRYDLRLLIYRGPDATSQSLGASDNPTAGSFEDQLFINTLLSASAVFLL